VGHLGSTLEQTSTPDFVEMHEVCACEGCGHCLKAEELMGYDKRQEFELPPVKAQVTEHRSGIKKCPICGLVNKAKFPECITQPVQYGAQVKSLATYFSYGQLLPYKRTQEIFLDLYSLPLSEGTLVNTNLSCYTKLEEYEAWSKQQLKLSDVVNFDESGMRVKTQLQWLHVAATDKVTHYEIHKKRGVEAMDAVAILPEFKGRAIHDHWKPYFNYQCKHGLCNAHHLREFIYHKEQYDQTWCSKMESLLLEIKDEIGECITLSANKLPLKRLAFFEKQFDNILNYGLKEIPIIIYEKLGKRGRKKRHPSENLLNRLKEYKHETLAFMYDFAVPFTNNQGERDIRMAKVKQKISGCFRSQQGAKTFCRIRGYLSTAKKQGVNVLESLQSVFKAKSEFPFFTTNE
jgi:transposase